MMALFGSVAHAPLAVMLMVAEMTGNLSMLAPAMVAVGLATFIVGQRSIYSSQLATRADSPAHRFRFALPLLAAVPVGDAARQARVVVHPDDTVASAREQMIAAHVPGAPVIARDGSVAGLIDLEALRDAPPDEAIPGKLIAREPILASDDGLDDALGALSDHRRDWAPVTSGRRLTGVLSVRDAIAAYRSALHGNVRQVRGLRADGVIVETEISLGSPLAGRRVAGVPWPRDVVLVAVERNDGVLVPRGDLEIEVGDRLSIFANPTARPALATLLHGEVEDSSPGVDDERDDEPDDEPDEPLPEPG